MTGPRLIKEYPAAILTLGGRWGALGTVAWIASRDLDLLAAVEAEEARWAGGESEGLAAVVARDLLDDLKADLRHYCGHGEECSCFVSACEQLVARASMGALSPAGVRDGATRTEKIEAWEFNSPGAIIARDGFSLLSHVGRLQFGAREVAEEWPGDVSRLEFIFKQSSPGAASPVEAHAPVRTMVEDEEFRLWVAARIVEGHDQTWVVANAKAAFPDNIVPGREDRRVIHRVEHRRLKRFDPKPGKVGA